MRKLTILVLTIAAIYAGYWFIGANAAEKGTRAALEQLQANGWSVQTNSVDTRGFPSRFDTTIKDLELTSPDQAYGWNAPFVQALALSYKPNQMIFVFPQTQELQLGGQKMTLNTEGFRASAAVAASPAAPLTNVTAELSSASLKLSPDTALQLGKSLAALRPSTATDYSYDAFLDIADIGLPQPLVSALSGYPAAISQLTVDTNVTLDRRLDRHLIGATSPRMDAMVLNALTLRWGTTTVQGKGSLAIDVSGIPTGQITLSLRNWDQLITAAAQLGLIEQGLVQTAQTMAHTLAMGSDTLDLPLVFENGLVRIGPLPLGPAPRFR